MPFFPRLLPPAALASRQWTNDLWRTLDSFPSSSAFPSAFGELSNRTFSPNFDVKETEKEYVLEGELPGLSKDQLNIEFTDDNTLLIRGRVERAEERAGDDPNNLKAIEPGQETKQIEGAGEKGKEVEAKKGAKGEQEKSKRPKYWVSERTVGEFSRAFAFPGRVNKDEVKASLENGILKLVVKKEGARPAKRISVL